MVIVCSLKGQPLPFQVGKKWGVKSGEEVVIPPKYDTVFGFDKSGRICMACFKVQSSSSNKFMTIKTLSFSCNYLDRSNNRLVIRNRSGDTCGIFSLARNSVEQYIGDGELFTVSTRGKRFLVEKAFRQLTFKGYHSVTPGSDPSFYVTELANEAETILTGVVNTREEPVVPNSYTSIRFNPFDSLIVACSAGLNNSPDDIYDYSGKRIASYPRHVEQATKRFVIHHLYEPKNHFLIYDIKKGLDQELVADEIQIAGGEKLRMRMQNEWFLYDMDSKEKTPIRQTEQ